MQPWLIRWQGWCIRKAAWDLARAECRADELRIRDFHQQVVAACALDETATTLAKALESAQRLIAKATAAQAARAKLTEDHKRAHSAHTVARDALSLAETKRDDWVSEWKRAVLVLRLADDSPSVKTVQDYLMRLDEMHVHLTQARLKAARVRQIDGDRTALLDRLTTLRQRLSPAAQTTTSISLDADFRALVADVRDATERRTRRKQLSEQLDQEKKREVEATARLRKAEATRTTLATEAGVTDTASIPNAIQRARQRSEIARQVSQYKAALAQNTRGEPMEEFIGSALSRRDSLDHDLETLERRLTELDPEITAAEAASLAARATLEGYRQASDAAAEARQKAEMLASRLQDHVVEYAALHVAHTSLELAKERYRARHQDTLLDRAGAFFRKLTDGAFEGIDIENDEGNDVLKAVRSVAGRPDARVSVEGLSDGTRDQLFLALRLAGIDRHLNDREPVPLIIDDVLVNFDDIRARTTLSCLAEMATKTQVLVFTHHRHVVELARAIDPSCGVHELGCAKPALSEGRSHDATSSSN